MAQTWDVPVVSGDTVSTALLSKINDALEALRTLHAGATTPSSTVARMIWQQTSGDMKIYQRNAANSADVEILVGGAKNHALEHAVRLAGLSASQDVYIAAPMQNCYLDRLVILSDVTTSGSAAGVDEYTFQLRNITQGLDLFATAPSTADTELTADTIWTAQTDQNQSVSADDVLELQITKTGSPTSLAGAELRFMVQGWLRGA